MSNENKSTIDKLMELKKLLESGMITKEEMEVLKQKILLEDCSVSNKEIEEVSRCESLNEDNEPNDEMISGYDSAETNPSLSESNDSDCVLQISNSHNEPQHSYKIQKVVNYAIIAGVCLAAVALIITLTQPNYSKRRDKAIEKYESLGASILSESRWSEGDEDNHYLIYKLGDTIFYDGLERRAAAKAILPRKGGFYIKKYDVEFEDGKPVLHSELINEGKRSNLNLSLLDCIDDSDLDGNRAVCLVECDKENCITHRFVYHSIAESQIYDYGTIRESYYYSMSNPDTIFLFEGPLTVCDGYSYMCYYTNFGEASEEYIPEWWGFSYRDYWFELRPGFSNSDTKPIDFGDFVIERENNLHELLSNRVGGGRILHDNCVAYPASWFGTLKMQYFYECLDEDLERREEEADRYYEEEQRKVAEKQRDEILDQTVDFYDMYQLYIHNPLKAEQQFEPGKEMYLMVKVNGVNRSDKDGYKYYLYTKNDYHNAYLLTNDESVVDHEYPMTVVVKAKFRERYTMSDVNLLGLFYELFVEDEGYKYVFEDVQLLYYRQDD